MLKRLKKLASPINVVIVGMGAMGQGLLYQCENTPGIRCIGIADNNIDKCRQSVDKTGRPGKLVDEISKFSKNDDGALAVCQDGNLLAMHPEADVFIESSSAIAEGGRFSETALLHNKHLILMNAEVDLVFGPYLLELAQQQGLVYSSCDGDQHGVIKRLTDEMELWGLEPVMSGNIKGYLDRYSNPTSIVPEADKRSLDYIQASGYTDGTKLNVEMALVANALGQRVLVPGMHGPVLNHINDVFKVFDFEKIWSPGDPAFVDYILGAEPGGGVFIIGHCGNPYQQSMLEYYKLGSGPFYLFYRPCHLCHIEAMRCIAEASLDGVSLLQPDCGFRSNVMSYAKRDLKPGDMLDGPGGYCVYGKIENFTDNSTGLPVCLADGVGIAQAVDQDQPVSFNDVNITRDRPDFIMYEKAIEASKRLRL